MRINEREKGICRACRVLTAGLAIDGRQHGVADMSAIAYGLGASAAAMVANPVGRSFVLGLPDRSGSYCIGFAGMVWRIPSGAYQPGDRVRVIKADQELLHVERVIN